MGLLEDAIREHLDLKRKHGAPEPELERQEVEALGPARRESAPQEAANEAAPVDGAIPAEQELPVEEPVIEAFDEETQLHVPPSEFDAPAPPPVDEAAPADLGHPAEPPVDHAPIADPEHAPLPQEPAVEHLPSEAEHAPPAQEPPVDQSSADVGHAEPSFDEPAAPDRSSVDQPTELFDVEGALAEEAPAEDDVEPRADDTPARGFPAQDEALEAEPPTGRTPPRGFPAQEEPFDDDEPAEGDEADVLEDTPDFLQDAPEHDRLWFEQKPPRDFDFD